MTFVEVPATIEAVLKFECEGSQMRNVLHFRFDGIGVPESMPGLMEELKVWYLGALEGVAASNTKFTGILLTDLSAADGAVLEWSPEATEWGANPSPSASANVTLAVKLGTGHRGRSARGRIYFVGMPATQVSGSYVATLHADNIVGAFTLLLDPAVIFAHKLVVASRYTANAPRVVGVTYVVTNLSANNVVDSQRRRLPGRGV